MEIRGNIDVVDGHDTDVCRMEFPGNDFAESSFQKFTDALESHRRHRLARSRGGSEFLRDLFDSVGFDDVSDFKILEAGEENAAFHAGTDLADFVLKST